MYLFTIVTNYNGPLQAVLGLFFSLDSFCVIFWRRRELFDAIFFDIPRSQITLNFCDPNTFEFSLSRFIELIMCH